MIADESDEIALLRADVDDLTAAVGTLLAEQQRTAGHSRWSWRHADAAASERLWAELIDWVNWLVPRYELTSEAASIPPCWYRHPVAVEELTALMAAWQAAYGAGSAGPREDLLAWHDRWLWPTVERLRLRAGWRSCADNGRHQDRVLRRWTPDPEMAAYVAAGSG